MQWLYWNELWFLDSTFDGNSENYTLNSNNKSGEGSDEKKLNLVPLQMVISRNGKHFQIFILSYTFKYLRLSRLNTNGTEHHLLSCTIYFFVDSN